MSLQRLSDDFGEPVVVLAKLWRGQTGRRCRAADRKSWQDDPACGFVLDGVSVTVDGGAAVVTVTGGDAAGMGLRNPASVHAIQARVRIATMNTAVAAAQRIRVGHMLGVSKSRCSKDDQASAWDG